MESVPIGLSPGLSGFNSTVWMVPWVSGQVEIHVVIIDHFCEIAL